LLADPAIPGLTDTLLPLDQPRRTQALSRLQALGLVSSASPSESRPSGGSRSDASASDLPAPGRSAEASLGLPRERGTPAGLDAPAASLDRSAEASLRLPRERGTPAGLDAHPLVREYFAERLRSSHAAAYRAAHRRLFEHLTKTTEHQPDTLDGLQPLYQAVRHGCEAGLHEEARRETYRDRILRGTGDDGFYSTRKLGGFGADLGAVACFFTQPWRELSPNLAASAQAWLLNEAASRLRALGRLTEALEPMRAGLEMLVAGRDWKRAAASAGNLSELDLTLGRVAEAVRDAKQAVEFADRSGDAFLRMAMRTVHADALHQAGRRDEARRLFEQAETMQAKDQPEYPRLYSLRSFLCCDLLLAEAERAAGRALVECGGKVRPVPGSDRDAALSSEVARVRAAAPLSGDPSQSGVASRSAASATALQSRRAVRERAAQTLEWVKTQDWLLDIALDHLTLGRVALYEAILTPLPLTACPLPLDAAVDGLRAAGTMHELPRGLLTRAWARAMAARSTGSGQGHLVGAQADLDEAWEIAARGEMKLHMVDVLLHRVRLFGTRNAEGGTRSGEGNVEHRASNVQRRSGEDGSPAAQTRPLNTEHRTLDTSLGYPWGSPAADLARARELIDATGYHRRDEELADLEASAQ
jgi:tetratricopeptide (TPR) repeat protein